jgi:hypothetical protein
MTPSLKLAEPWLSLTFAPSGAVMTIMGTWLAL